MGSKFSQAKRRRAAAKERRIVLLGLDSAGKTTLSRVLVGDDHAAETTPTMQGGEAVAVHVGDVLFRLWDVGGQSALRPYWRHFWAGCQGIIFMVDAADTDRLPEARSELSSVLEAPELHGVPVLVLLNKSDIPGALSLEEASTRLRLDEVTGKAESALAVHAVSVTTQEGLDPALSWLAEQSRPATAAGGAAAS